MRRVSIAWLAKNKRSHRAVALTETFNSQRAMRAQYITAVITACRPAGNHIQAVHTRHNFQHFIAVVLIHQLISLPRLAAQEIPPVVAENRQSVAVITLHRKRHPARRQRNRIQAAPAIILCRIMQNVFRQRLRVHANQVHMAHRRLHFIAPLRAQPLRPRHRFMRHRIIGRSFHRHRRHAVSHRLRHARRQSRCQHRYRQRFQPRKRHNRTPYGQPENHLRGGACPFPPHIKPQNHSRKKAA